MTPSFDASAVQTFHHYLTQISKLIDLIEKEPEPQSLLRIKLAPDMGDTGFNLAVAIGFAARALCLPAGVTFPSIPETITCATLRGYHQVIATLVAQSETMFTSPVAHQAGETMIEQEVADYILRFALPNMIFHLTMAYAGLRHGGMQIGKADFDGLHIYTNPLGQGAPNRNDP